MFDPIQKISRFVLILTCLNLGACASTSQRPIETKSKLVETVMDTSHQVIGKIDWREGRIFSYGRGHMRTPAPHTVSPGRQHAFADAQHTMLDVIRHLQLDVYNQAEVLFRYAVISRHLNAWIKLAKIEQTGQYGEQHYITASLPLTGDKGITQIFIPSYRAHMSIDTHTADYVDWQKHDQSKIWPKNYSSVIIDARGLNYRPALFASIVDENNNTLYSLDRVDPNAALYMLCEYTDSMHAARQSPRAGSTPLILTAQASVHDSSAKYVLTQDDAERLVVADSRGRFLRNARVIVVLDD